MLSLQNLCDSADCLGANVFVADAQLNLIHANKSARETLRQIGGEIYAAFQISVDKLVGGSIHRFHRNAASVERILSNPSALPHTAEFRFGGVALHCNISACYDDNHSLLGYMVSWSDVSRQKRVEAEKDLIRRMMESAPVNMMFADTDLILRYMNAASYETLRASESFLDVRADDMIGKPIDLFHKRPEAVRRILSNPQHLPYEGNIIVGPESWNIRVHPLYDEAKRYLGPMVSWKVITEKLRLERQAQELEEKRQQAEAGLRRYALELERQNRELQDFARVVAHDLQEPLRKIVTFSDLVKNNAPGLNERADDYLLRLQRATERMQALLDSIAQLSQASATPPSFSMIDLEAVTREVVDVMEPRLAKTRGRIQIERLPHVFADATQMYQLFQNLLGNALKFHKQNEPPEIVVSSRQMGSAWIISVRDNGIGFDPKYTELIFKPFQRLHGRNQYEGTGMGLAICQKIVKNHHGEITVKSVPDAGTVFFVKLPAKAPEP